MKLAAKADKGRLVWADPTHLAICLRHFDGQPVTVEIEKQTAVRTDRANRRYFGVILPMYRAFIDAQREEQGQEPLDWGPGQEWKERLHDALVRRHAGVVETAAGMIRKSTRRMDTREFFDFTESIVRELASNGWYVPEQGEAVSA